jgi:hypothetical protein
MVANPRRPIGQYAGRGLAVRRAYRYDSLVASKLLSIQRLPNHGIHLKDLIFETKLRYYCSNGRHIVEKETAVCRAAIVS